MPPENTPETTVEATAPQILLRKDVAAQLAASGPKVRGIVVDLMVEKEIEKRKAAVLATIDKLEAKTKELRKAEKSGTTTYDANGAPTGAFTFTKDQAESMKKLREEIAKLEGALTKALNDSDFTKLNELSSGGNKPQGGPPAEAPSAE